MLVEIWKDNEGVRMSFEDSDFELTGIAYHKLIEAMRDVQEQEIDEDDEGIYETIALDLEEN